MSTTTSLPSVVKYLFPSRYATWRLSPWRFVALETFYNPSSGDLRLFFYQDMPRGRGFDPHGRRQLTRVNSINILDEGLRIGGRGRRMNSKVKLVEISMYRK
jgi:hypothetical protein